MACWVNVREIVRRQWYGYFFYIRKEIYLLFISFIKFVLLEVYIGGGWRILTLFLFFKIYLYIAIYISIFDLLLFYVFTIFIYKYIRVLIQDKGRFYDECLVNIQGGFNQFIKQ